MTNNTIKNLKKFIHANFFENIEYTQWGIVFEDKKSSQKITISASNIKNLLMINLYEELKKPDFGTATDFLFPLLNTSHSDLTKKNDAILFFFKHPNTLLIFLIELKRKSLNDYNIQLNNGERLIKFYLEHLSSHNKIPNDLKFSYKKIAFTENLRKGAIKTTRSSETYKNTNDVFLYTTPVISINDLLKL